MSQYGDTALAGAPYRDNAEKGDTGAAYVFTRSAGAWTLLAQPVAADGAATDRFGFSVAVSGGSALIGAPYRNVALNADAGAAYVFVVTPTPAISKLSPASGKRGATVTIAGTGFGATRGSGSVTFGGKKCTKYVSWSATKIQCKVPSTAKYGTVKVKVTTAGGVSNARDFKVKR
jgi:hypothetical protein